jgi:hypothetical protein
MLKCTCCGLHTRSYEDSWQYAPLSLGGVLSDNVHRSCNSDADDSVGNQGSADSQPTVQDDSHQYLWFSNLRDIHAQPRIADGSR